MVTRMAEAEWRGDFETGQGRIKLGSAAYATEYVYRSRFESAPETGPEELSGAVEAGYFTMALALGLTGKGHPPKSIRTKARVRLLKDGDGFSIERIKIETEGNVPGISEADFHAQVALAKKDCPVSKALTATPIKVHATLLKS